MAPSWKRRFVKGMAVLLSASMLAATTGCGGAGSKKESSQEITSASDDESREQTDLTSGETEETETGSVDPEPEVKVKKTPAVKITDNGKAIWDFDEFVNGELYAMTEKKVTQNYSSQMNYLMQKRILDIFNNTDLDSLSEDDGLYKAVSTYRQILDPSNYDQRIKALKEMLAPIEKAKTLEDLYKLYADPKYAALNYALYFDPEVDEDGDNAPSYDPAQILTRHNETILSEGFSIAGYSMVRTLEILNNTSKVDEKIKNYQQALWTDGVYYAIYQYQLDNHGITLPVFEILETDPDNWFYADFRCYDLWNELFQEENVGMLRDYLICSVIAENCELIWKNSFEMDWLQDYAANWVMLGCCDVIMEEYKRLYLEDAIPEIDAMIEEIKSAEKEVIANSDWLDTHGKEVARGKILRMTQSIASNDINYDASNVTLTGNVFNDVNALRAGHLQFMRQQIGSGVPGLYNCRMDQTNGYYFSGLNRIVINSGWLSAPFCEKDAAFEERLACLGTLIAHEISHSFDPSGDDFEYDKYYDPLKSGKDAYWDKVKKIEEFFDGLEVEYGEKLDGTRVRGETFADLIAIQCCLSILEKQENPDYDLFFRTYAETYEATYTKDGMKEAVRDEHLPGKERINYVLGQFDEFYETYDIDESSPYFVPAEKRLKLF